VKAKGHSKEVLEYYD